MLCNVLKVDWAKFGWIAAAFSVGLGFGLQEVVANFVCGLILLFERPIRVGDIITIEGTTGTAIHVGAEGYWHEGPASADVTIRNNRFLGCGRGEGTIHGTSAVAVNVDAPRTNVPGIHRRVLIEGNQVVDSICSELRRRDESCRCCGVGGKTE